MDLSATEREEGEISDDYDEIISDDESIIINAAAAEKAVAASGKSIISTQELIRTISLSSVSTNYSEDEVTYVEATQLLHHRQRQRRTQKNTKKQRTISTNNNNRKLLLERRRYPKPKRKRYSDFSDSESDSTDYVKKSLKRQLKEAVQVQDPAESSTATTNTLQTRLQRMINPNYSKSKPVLLEEEDEELLALRDIALLSTQKKEEEEIVNTQPEDKLNTSNDQELMDLRIIALKSAVLNKHQSRQQKKMEQAWTASPDDLPLIPIPNLDNLDEIPLPPSPPPVTVIEKVDENLQPNNRTKNEVNIEEDEDVMRAMLLASMSKKITSSTVPPLPQSPLASTILKETVNSANNNKGNKLVTVLPSIPIKKIIINVNSESDSDVDTSPQQSTKRSTQHNDENKLVHGADENFSKNLSMLLKQARENMEKSPNLPLSTATAEDISLDKSVVKLLPRSQQAEYKQLKHKLQLLRARKRMIATADGAPTTLRKFVQQTKMVPKTLHMNNKANKVLQKGVKNFKVNNMLKNKILQQEQRKLAPDGKNVQDRLSTKELLPPFRTTSPPTVSCNSKNKYEELETLMRQIDDVRKKRDEQQTVVQNLLTQLKMARNRLGSVHQHFTSLVQKLVTAKTNIDKKWLVAINETMLENCIFSFNGLNVCI